MNNECTDEQHFNSIKVQLKQESDAIEENERIYFNSIKVQLKPTTPVIFTYLLKFQFHKGTIKTRLKEGGAGK